MDSASSTKPKKKRKKKRGRKQRRGVASSRNPHGGGSVQYRPQRAYVDSDDASVASSVSSDIAADYVRNLMMDDEADKSVSSDTPLDPNALQALVGYAHEPECTMEIEGGLLPALDLGPKLKRRNPRAKQPRRPLSSLSGDPVKGKGLDMLRRMGWEDGTGLGVNADGRTEPIDVNLQRSRRGIGSGSASASNKRK